MRGYTKMVKIGKNFFVTCIFFLACSLRMFASAEPLVKSYFSSAKAKQNSSIAYIIEVSDGSVSSDIALPEVNGLVVKGVSTRQEINSVNWQTVRKFLYIFHAQVTTTNSIVVPLFDIEVNGKKVTVPSAKLEVIDGPIDSLECLRNQIFLTVDVPNKPVYVGEMCTAQINVFVADGVKASFLGNMPVKCTESISEKFIGETREQPSFFEINGVRYRKFVWDTVLVPLKSGDNDLVYTLNVVVWMSEHVPGPNDTIGLFQSFDNIFENIITSKKVELSIAGSPAKLHVVSLPDSDKFEDFSGAIGLFDITDVSTSAYQTTVGEPILLKVVVQGDGNFGTKYPSINVDDNWQVHAPRMVLEQDVSVGIKGKKTFEYVIIPNKTGAIKLPSPIKFTFFDSQKDEYVEASREVNGEVIVARDDKVTIDSVDTNKTEIKPNFIPEKDTFILKIEVGEINNKFSSITHNPWFWVAGILMIIFIVICVIRRKIFIRMNGNSEFASRRNSNIRLGKALINMERAVGFDDAVSFFAFAQYAIRECLSVKQGNVGAAMTFDDIAKVMLSKNVTNELFDNIREIYSKGDEIRFSEANAEIYTQDELQDKFKSYQKIIIALRHYVQEGK